MQSACRIGKKMHKRWLTFLGISAVCIAAIWLPFGFAMTGLIEEWHELSMQTFQGPLFFVDIRQATLEALRPLGHFPFGLAFVLGPDSFVSWHVMLMLALALKGCAASELVYKAARSLPIAAIAGVLFVLYPADTMQYPFRALHINWSLALGLLASCVYLAAWDRREPRGLWATAAAALLLAATLTYEVALTCLAVPFLILVARDGLAGFARGLRERPGQVAIWCLVAVLYGAYAMWMSQATLTYEAKLLNGGGLFAGFTASFPKLISLALPRALFGGWFDAFGMAAEEYQSYIYLGVAASALGGLLYLICRKRQETASSTAGMVRLACMGVAAAALGYAPYLLSPAHVEVSQRTYLFASFGAVVFWSAVLIGIRYVAKHLFGPAVAAFILLGLGAQLVQFNHYVRIAQEQKRVLRGIVENFDERSEGKTLIVIDASGRLGRT